MLISNWYFHTAQHKLSYRNPPRRCYPHNCRHRCISWQKECIFSPNDIETCWSPDKMLWALKGNRYNIKKFFALISTRLFPKLFSVYINLWKHTKHLLLFKWQRPFSCWHKYKLISGFLAYWLLFHTVFLTAGLLAFRFCEIIVSVSPASAKRKPLAAFLGTVVVPSWKRGTTSSHDFWQWTHVD